MPELNRKIRAFWLIGLALLSACSPQRPALNSAPGLKENDLRLSVQEPNWASAADEQVLPEAYRLGFGDGIEVKLSTHPEFNEQVLVRPDGRISLQEIGDIVVLGMTPAALDSFLTRAYAKILHNPNVTVILRQFGGQQVYVLGEVDRPGVYPLERNMTILRALTAAGGPKASGNLKSVMVIRQNHRNKLSAVRVDLALRSLPQELQRDLFVQANDVIYLPKTFVANVNQFLAQVYDGILPPLDIYTRWRYWLK